MISIFDFFNKYNKLSKEAKEAIAAISITMEVRKNTDLQSAMEVCKTIYFIKKGLARVYYYKDGTDITESFALENSLIARAEGLLEGKPSRKAIQVIEDSVVIAIHAESLFKLYDTHPDIERLFRKLCESAYMNLLNRMESIQFNTAEERYNILVKEAPELIKRIPLKYIASYLGITQVSLSRIRRKQCSAFVK